MKNAFDCDELIQDHSELWPSTLEEPSDKMVHLKMITLAKPY
jgi:hypothetical protein